MNKVNERLTLIANLSVVAGVVFLAAEMRQNTSAIQAQTRDSITEKQMQWLESIYASEEIAELLRVGSSQGYAEFSPAQARRFNLIQQANFREWENSFYQYQRGLFTGAEFEARVARWRRNLGLVGVREVWSQNRETFAPDFPAEIDRIVAEVAE